MYSPVLLAATCYSQSLTQTAHFRVLSTAESGDLGISVNDYRVIQGLHKQSRVPLGGQTEGIIVKGYIPAPGEKMGKKGGFSSLPGAGKHGYRELGAYPHKFRLNSPVDIRCHMDKCTSSLCKYQH
jgi:hypothetical protein